MWIDYQKERFAYESIEENWGFVLFSVAPPLLALQDFYVKPEVRGQGRGTELLDRLIKIGQERKCTQIWAQVWLNDRNAKNTLKAAWATGFIMASAAENKIILLKAIEGG